MMSDEEKEMFNYALWLLSNLILTRADEFLENFERLYEFMEGVEALLETPAFQAHSREAVYCLGNLVYFSSPEAC